MFMHYLTLHRELEGGYTYFRGFEDVVDMTKYADMICVWVWSNVLVCIDNVEFVVINGLEMKGNRNMKNTVYIV